MTDSEHQADARRMTAEEMTALVKTMAELVLALNSFIVAAETLFPTIKRDLPWRHPHVGDIPTPKSG
jgi:hypothetical protein